MTDYVEVEFYNNPKLEKKFDSLEDAHKVKKCWFDAILRNKNENVKYIRVISKPDTK